jgi:hypothetical protein
MGGGGRRVDQELRYEQLPDLPPLEPQTTRGPFSSLTDGRQHGPCALSVPDVM